MVTKIFEPLKFDSIPKFDPLETKNKSRKKNRLDSIESAYVEKLNGGISLSPPKTYFLNFRIHYIE